jgi:hypothetical protein
MCPFYAKLHVCITTIMKKKNILKLLFLTSGVMLYSCAPVSKDSVFTVSVIHFYRGLKKKLKIKEINGSYIS